jgi:RNA polymerase sigma factor (sigma-70 family)
MINSQENLNASQLAVKEIFELHYDELLAYGRNFAFENRLVEDALHDLFVQFIESPSNILNARDQKSYLKTSLKHAIINQLQKNNKISLGSNLVEIAIPSYEELLIDKISSAQEALFVAKLLDNLTTSQKTILTLRFYRSMSYDEIAQKLDISKRTVYNQIHEAMQKMRKIGPQR